MSERLDNARRGLKNELEDLSVPGYNPMSGVFILEQFVREIIADTKPDVSSTIPRPEHADDPLGKEVEPAKEHGPSSPTVDEILDIIDTRKVAEYRFGDGETIVKFLVPSTIPGKRIEILIRAWTRG